MHCKDNKRQLSILHYYAQKLIATGCLFAQIAYKQYRGKTSTNKWYPRAITHIIHFNFIKVLKNKQSGKQNKEKPTFFNPFIYYSLIFHIVISTNNKEYSY